MSTKPKPAKPKGKAEPQSESLESRLTKAIELVSEDKCKEAIPIFEAIATEAADSGNYGMARIANNYIAHAQPQSMEPTDIDSIQKAVFLLNAKQPEEALQILEKLIEADSSSAHLNYLKALAHANAQDPEQAAQSLKSAIDLDPALIHVYTLEPDFKPYRNSSSFAEIESI